MHRSETDPRQTWIRFFATGMVAATAVGCGGRDVLRVIPPEPVEVGQSAALSAEVGGGRGWVFSWEAAGLTSPWQDTPETHVAFADPGHHPVRLRARRGQREIETEATVIVRRALTPTRPTQSSTLAYDPHHGKVWNANPDNDSVSAVDPASLRKLSETPVGRNPRTLAVHPDGTIWVANQDDATLSVLDGVTAEVIRTVDLPRACRPFGIAVAPDGGKVYVATEGSGQVLRIDPATHAVDATVEVGAPLRGLAITADGRALFATRFISSDEQGEVIEIGLDGFTETRRIALPPDTTTADSEAGARGLPNHLQSATVSPCGTQLWLPFKQDNIFGGIVRDGKALHAETAVRTLVSAVDLATGREVFRRDLGRRDMAHAAVFCPDGAWAFVSVQGSNTVELLDGYTGESLATVSDVDLAPQGLALAPDGSALFVHCFLTRTVRAFRVERTAAAPGLKIEEAAAIPVVAEEAFPPNVLRGKQVFYEASDPRMSAGFISCASCHLDGGYDGRVWDHTQRGEGLRMTISLLGKRGIGQGRVHWSANFDEIQDFEHDMRNHFGGTGFLTDEQFNEGTRNHPLGDRKAGLSPDLDALAAYVMFLNEVPASPHREPDGEFTPDARAGRELFLKLDCTVCHSGPDYTDSPTRLLHDVGTLRPASGRRLGGTLPGIDTPTLRGVWATPPHLHDGSAATLLDVLEPAPGRPGHGGSERLSAEGRRHLAAFLKQLDGDVPDPEPGPPVVQVTTSAPETGIRLGQPVRIEAEVHPRLDVSRVELWTAGDMLERREAPPYVFEHTPSRRGRQTYHLHVHHSDYVRTWAEVSVQVNPGAR